jgi:FKBP-type peptidyl-prolyl cis-trans isomerase FkpA
MRLFLILASVAMISCSSAPESSGSKSSAPAEQPSGQAFLDKAAAEPGAVKTASGLVYHEITPGNGVSPKATDTVKVHYRGTLIDGTEFDSSYKRNEPAEFPLNRVIPCWTEGVQKMKVGGKARLVCPASIAYGDAGSPPVIPGGATLVFEIELLGVTPS